MSAHNAGRIETATFSDVSWHARPAATGKTTLINTLETISVRSKDRRVAYVVTQPGRIEAPNWYPDAPTRCTSTTAASCSRCRPTRPGRRANPNRQATPEPVDLGILTRINNDHGITADGKLLGDQRSVADRQRPAPVAHLRRAVRADAKRVTEQGPSYFHGWSPDGRTLTYCAQRNGNFDVYTVPADGGRRRA